MIKKLLLGCVVAATCLQASAGKTDKYLFAYFTGNKVEDESIHFAVSDDGFNWKALNGNRPVIDSKAISLTGGVRDPHIMRRHDGKGFYMVVTDMVSSDGWDSNRGLVMLKSENLTDWQHTAIHIPSTFKGNDDLLRVWAPQTIYDPEAGKYMVYWSMKHGDGPDIIYYAYANDDFTGFDTEPRQLFFPSDGLSCIDADIVSKDGMFYMFYKTEGHGNGIKLATSRSLTSGKWHEHPDYKQQTRHHVEGAGVFKLAGEDRYVLMYDVYKNKRYDFTVSDNLTDFRPADRKVTMDFHPRHGSVMPITKKEMKRLKSRF